MTAAITLMAKQRGGSRIDGQLLYYPVIDASFDNPSHYQFATGYWLRLDAMRWFWDQYTTDPAQRAEITASPLRATTEDLAGLPPALVINGEADLLRDEGEAYAAKLRAAGVPVTSVRYNGTIHDFVMLAQGLTLTNYCGFIDSFIAANPTYATVVDQQQPGRMAPFEARHETERLGQQVG
jgi:acetyl esterase